MQIRFGTVYTHTMQGKPFATPQAAEELAKALTPKGEVITYSEWFKPRYAAVDNHHLVIQKALGEAQGAINTLAFRLSELRDGSGKAATVKNPFIHGLYQYSEGLKKGVSRAMVKFPQDPVPFMQWEH
jgi:hypothetical protein